MKPIKLLHTADIHIGMENYGRIDPETGINARVMDFLRRLTDIGDYAIENDVDVFIFAGDAYRTRDPNPTYQREFARRMKRIADAGIPVVMLVGNHDLPAVSRRASSIDIFGTLDVPNVTVAYREEIYPITCRDGQPLHVAAIPYPLRSALISREDHQGKSLAELDGILQGIMIDNARALAAQAQETPDIPAILMGHFSISEASHGSEKNIMIGRDASVPRSELANPAWRYVAMGHIHKHQSLNRDLQPPIIYSGSIERIDFGEEHEEKGFVVAEITDGPTTWDFIPGYHLRARPFLTIEVDVRGATDPTETIIAEIGRHGDLSKTVVKLIVQLRQEQEPLLVEREIKRALDDAYFVAAMQKDVQRTDRGRIGGISIETLTPQELLASYFEIKGVTPERTKLLLEHAQTLMQDDFTG